VDLTIRLSKIFSFRARKTKFACGHFIDFINETITSFTIFASTDDTVPLVAVTAIELLIVIVHRVRTYSTPVSLAHHLTIIFLVSFARLDYYKL